MKNLNQKLVYALGLFVLLASCKDEKKTEAIKEVELAEKAAETPEEQLA